jgi:starvation-inducible outer membrane lipoprotein
MHDSGKSQIMGWVALLMVLQLSGCIGNGPSTLHQNTTESMSGCITIDHEVFLDIGKGKNRGGGKLLFQSLEDVLALGRPFKLISLLQ